MTARFSPSHPLAWGGLFSDCGSRTGDTCEVLPEKLQTVASARVCSCVAITVLEAEFHWRAHTKLQLLMCPPKIEKSCPNLGSHWA